MTAALYITWFLLSLGISVVILHQIGKKYGAHVSMSAATGIAVLMAAATSVGLAIGFTRWLAL